MSKELEVLYLTLDSMERFIPPAIFKDLKSDVQSIDFKINRLAEVEKLLELYKMLYIVCKEYECASIVLSDDSEFLNVMSKLECELI